MADRDAVRTAVLVLVFSVLLELGGVLLAGDGGVLTVVGVALIAFGLMGLVQALGDTGAGERSGRSSGEDGGGPQPRDPVACR
jgi:hypothetical protein